MDFLGNQVRICIGRERGCLTTALRHRPVRPVPVLNIRKSLQCLAAAAVVPSEAATTALVILPRWMSRVSFCLGASVQTFVKATPQVLAVPKDAWTSVIWQRMNEANMVNKANVTYKCLAQLKSTTCTTSWIRSCRKYRQIARITWREADVVRLAYLIIGMGTFKEFGYGEFPVPINIHRYTL